MLLKSDRLKSISMDKPAKSGEKGKGKRIIKVSIWQSKIQHKSMTERICWIHTVLGMLTGPEFPGSRKFFPLTGKKFPEREFSGNR